MRTYTPAHVFFPNETLTADLQNGLRNDIVQNILAILYAAIDSGGAFDLDGQELVFDGDGDLKVVASSDDVLEFKIGSTTLFKLDLSTASAVNGLTVTPSAAASPVGLDAFGSDTDVSVLLTPKGAGTLRLANLTAACVLVSDADKGVTSSSTTTTNLASLDTTTSLTTQLAGKLSSGAGVITNTNISATADISRSKIVGGTPHRLVVNAITTGLMTDAAAITAARALISDSNGIPTASSVTSTELALLSGATALGGMVPLASYAPSAAASVDITDVIDSTYTIYRIVYKLSPATDGVDLWLRFDTNNGASFETSGYRWATSEGDSSASDSKCIIAGGTTPGSVGNTSGEIAVGEVLICGTSNPRYTGWTGYARTDGAFRMMLGTGVLSSALIDSAQLLFSSGNMTGNVEVFGVLQS